MSKSQTPTAKAKKFQVFVGVELKAESNNHEEALTKVSELQKENVSEIKLVNHVAKVSHLYTKGRYDKNYRITGTDYATPSKAVTEETAAE
jgi:hypothetical protein